jgi:hyperosmotically inducible protein
MQEHAMSASLRRSILVGPVVALAAAGLLAGCQKVTTTQSPDGTTTTITTTTVIPTEPSASTSAAMKSAASEIGSEASAAMSKAGVALEDGVITTKVKTALLADPDVKGLSIDVDTKDGVVTLKGTADKASAMDRAAQIARDTSGVKSVDNQLVVKTPG